jgi:hypothetical protein
LGRTKRRIGETERGIKKMTTLRQEIQNRIEIIQYADDEQIYPDDETGQILKLFEKMIDEKKKRYEYKMGEITTDINEGYCRACRELKEELKK